MKDGAEYLKSDEAAKLLRVSTHTLKNWRRYGSGPPFVRLGPTVVRYQRVELEEWIEARRRTAEGA